MEKAIHDKMKYFEIHEPYYALIKAESKEKAIDIYTEQIADDEGNINEEIKEVSELEALKQYVYSFEHEPYENTPIREVLNGLKYNEVLLLDGNLL